MSVDIALTVVQILLGIGALAATYRLIAGPDLSDRATALDVLVLLIASGVAAQGARSGSELFTPLLIVVGLVAFVATATIARYAEWRAEEGE